MLALIVDGGIGGTFLDWTWHRLIGDACTYNARQRCWINLPSDPISGQNAHGFSSNHPVSLDQLHRDLDVLARQPGQHSVYIHEFDTIDHTQQAIDIVLAACDRSIRVTLDDQLSAYHCRWGMGRHRMLDPAGNRYPDPDHQQQGWMETWFNDSMQHWPDRELQDPWNYREFLALNIDPNHKLSQLSQCHGQFDHDWSAQDLWMNLPALIRDLSISTRPDIWHSWTKVYARWQQLHIPNWEFARDLPGIVDDILVGKNRDLAVYQLDLVQEAVILGKLIKQHGLNLRAHGLERFSHTCQLHDLLEPSQHS